MLENIQKIHYQNAFSLHISISEHLTYRKFYIGTCWTTLVLKSRHTKRSSQIRVRWYHSPAMSNGTDEDVGKSQNTLSLMSLLYTPIGDFPGG